jgi:sporulation protein YlmC with PRC-barrel domain
MIPLKGLRRVRDITGATVKNGQGEELGFVYDLIISSEGCIQYAILSYDEFLGAGDRMIPIPWRMVVEEGHTVVIDVDRKLLDGAPGFDSKTWPLMSEARWQEAIGKYFEHVPDKMPRKDTRDWTREGPEVRDRITH